MPFSSKEALQDWLREFAAVRDNAVAAPYVADQEPTDGRDSGLVIFPLRNATTSVFIRPVTTGAPEWRVTIEAQPEITELTPQELHDLCRELDGVADLCTFLQQKTNECAGQHSAAR
ncbi:MULTISPECIES: hypothetical protein [unclassified Microbacterium]|uniref:hypothetical protein n=1 Tax=unclassified Microbacterium TaxID=2609290 RepID=UPI0009786F27|nr:MULTISPECIES: hypothetical protein [unclassified Microbacterium]